MTLKKLASSVATAALLAAMPVAIALPMGLMPTAAQAQNVQVSFNLFYDRLRPHGTWVRHERYRYVWCPSVDADWRPYTRGRWVYLADRGWYFASDEPFAWAAYHYGRWYDDDRLGWCWVPGRTWAPAWVSWRRAPDYVGWAPLPPQDDGFSVSIEVNFGEPPEDDWFFVPVRSFLEPNLAVSVVYSDRDPEIYRRAEPLGPVIVQNNIVINTVIDIDIIQQETGQTVEVVEAQPVEDPEAAGDAEGNTVPVFEQEIAPPAENEAPPEALEPEEAEEQIGQPPEEGEDMPAEGEEAEQDDAAPAEGEAPANEQAGEAPANEQAGEAPANEQAAEPAAPAEGEAVDCPEGQEARDGVCVAVEAEAGAEGEEAPAEEAPAEEAPAEQAPAEQAPAEQAPAEQPAAPAQEAPAQQPAAPAEQAPAQEAPAEQPAAPAEQAPAQEAPAAQPESAPAQPPAGAPAPCPEGQVPAEGGACRPAG